jgi:hypothetical protein
MLRLELLSTEHCGLCDQALDLLLGMPEVAGLELVVTDIADDPQLMSAYADRIPVLRALGQELAAPFGAREVLGFLDRLAAQYRTSDAR